MTLCQVEISCQTYTPALLKVRMEESKDGNITHLKLHMNFLSSIAKQISQHPSLFFHLFFLNLAYNNISSLECLQRLDLRNLRELHLFHNNLTNLRFIRKCNFSHLKFLSIVNNRIVRIEGVQDWNLAELEQLIIYDNEILQVEGLVRGNFNNLTHLILGQQFENRDMLHYMLKTRFPNYLID